ncbi:hypothetical protein EYC84_008230 [Monilinia fructicola]|uniref:Uncharacterized protein n=1 Tax=Monilinia fructicola TaxID=38448 RepID=A0A5M9JHE8_MONFR|nr:hypothetical protein EYC84_008230 [Monilinia fructicola]
MINFFPSSLQGESHLLLHISLRLSHSINPSILTNHNFPMLLQVATQPKSHNLDVCQRAKRREEGKKKNEEVRKEGTLSPRGTGSLSLSIN